MMNDKERIEAIRKSIASLSETEGATCTQGAMDAAFLLAQLDAAEDRLAEAIRLIGLATVNNELIAEEAKQWQDDCRAFLKPAPKEPSLSLECVDHGTLTGARPWKHGGIQRYCEICLPNGPAQDG